MGSFEPHDIRLSFEFSKPREVRELDSFFGAMLSFFSVAFGVEAKFHDYLIQPADEGEIELSDGSKAPIHFHLIWPAPKEAEKDDSDSVVRPRSFFRSWQQDERDTFARCLAAWVDRWQEWRGPAAASVYAFREDNIFDGHRLISACKWVETTPGATQAKIHGREPIREMLRAAKDVADRFDLDFGKRLQNSLFQLRTESRRSLVQRLVAEIAPLAKRLDQSKMVADVMKGFGIRGDFAHERFHHDNDQSFGDYVRATKAVECLGFLLLVKDLPLPRDFDCVFDPYPMTEYIVHYQ